MFGHLFVCSNHRAKKILVCEVCQPGLVCAILTWLTRDAYIIFTKQVMIMNSSNCNTLTNDHEDVDLKDSDSKESDVTVLLVPDRTKIVEDKGTDVSDDNTVRHSNTNNDNEYVSIKRKYSIDDNVSAKTIDLELCNENAKRKHQNNNINTINIPKLKSPARDGFRSKQSLSSHVPSASESKMSTTMECDSHKDNSIYNSDVNVNIDSQHKQQRENPKQKEKEKDKEKDKLEVRKEKAPFVARWIKTQTKFAYRIMYIYLYWYLFIMFKCGAIYQLNLRDIGTCLLMTIFIGILLNSSAYKKPFKKYISNVFFVARLFLIPCCVSSFSIGCSKSDQCYLLFPTTKENLIGLFGGQIGIIIVGSIIRHFIVKNSK